MRIRFLFVFVVVLGLAGCAGMPTWTAGGTEPPPPADTPTLPPADEPGVPADDAVAGPVKGDEVDAVDVLTAVAPLLPPPWGWLVPILGMTVVALTKKGK